MPYTEINGVGPVLFERSKRAKRIIITVKRDKRVRVAIPNKTSFAEAEKFARSKKDWIRKQLIRLSQVRHVPEETPLDFDLPAANKKIIDRTMKIATQHEFNFNRLAIRNQKTLWGSCSTKNNISLNIKLAILPEDLMDYVILHELVHIKIKNHGPQFWTELAKYVNNPKQRASEMKIYKAGIS